MSRKRRVFISYAEEDFATVKKLYDDLNNREVNVWLDKVNLRMGPWKKQIRKAIVQSTDFIICLSQAALRKTSDEPGFVDEELSYAWQVAQTQSDTEFTIIPVRLEDCARGDHRLSVYQQYDLFKDWDGVLDQLAVQLDGHALGDVSLLDIRSEQEDFLESLLGEADSFYHAGKYEKALQIWNAAESTVGEISSIRAKKHFVLGELGQLGEDEPRPLNEAKLILVGFGEVGKTSLVNRLVHATFNPQESTTQGINIIRWHPLVTT